MPFYRYSIFENKYNESIIQQNTNYTLSHCVRSLKGLSRRLALFLMGVSRVMVVSAPSRSLVRSGGGSRHTGGDTAGRQG